jgi:hypothetical protein
MVRVRSSWKREVHLWNKLSLLQIPGHLLENKRSGGDMAGIEIYVKDEKEKTKLIEDYLAADVTYLQALDSLKEELKEKGIDLETRGGRKHFITAVRRLNTQFGKELHKKVR